MNDFVLLSRLEAHTKGVYCELHGNCSLGIGLKHVSDIGFKHRGLTEYTLFNALLFGRNLGQQAEIGFDLLLLEVAVHKLQSINEISLVELPCSAVAWAHGVSFTAGFEFLKHNGGGNSKGSVRNCDNLNIALQHLVHVVGLGSLQQTAVWILRDVRVCRGLVDLSSFNVLYEVGLGLLILDEEVGDVFAFFYADLVEPRHYFNCLGIGSNGSGYNAGAADTCVVVVIADSDNAVLELSE